MNAAASRRADVTRHWLFVLALVGLDYFSTLAYLPSIAVQASGPLAPFAALLVVLVTWLFAVPVYLYVVGRSSDGRGAIGLLSTLVTGWRGKLIALTLLGFAAADFVVTKSLSISDAAEHVMHNPHGHQLLDRLLPVRETIREQLGPERFNPISPYITRQVLITLALSTLTFGLWYLLRDGFTRKVAVFSTIVVSAYLAMTGIVVASGIFYLARNPDIVATWLAQVGLPSAARDGVSWEALPLRAWLAVAIWSFPQMSLGMSGFELTMAVAPLVRGSRRDARDEPAARVHNARKLMLAAAAVMGVFLVSSTLVTALLVPHDALGAAGPAEHRALAYLAHGEPLVDGTSAATLNPWFGDDFGSLFDLASTAILCLAGASVMVGLGRLVPGYLHRSGMDLSWAGKVGVVMHLLNAVILLVTIVFRASLSDQLWAYATSVLVLIGGAALAAAIDVGRRWRTSRWMPLVALPFAVTLAFYIAATGMTVYINQSGVAIACLFVATIFATSFLSRWLRSTELRFEGFAFPNETSQARWRELCDLDRLILVPHRPGIVALAERHRAIRVEYLLSPDAPIIFVEVTMGDPSEFYQRPELSIEREGALDVIRVSKAVSVAHVLAAIALEIAKVGRPPTLIFGWSYETPLAANLSFLFLGEGNIPWMVKALVRRAAPQVERQPRIIIG